MHITFWFEQKYVQALIMRSRITNIEAKCMNPTCFQAKFGRAEVWIHPDWGVVTKKHKSVKNAKKEHDSHTEIWHRGCRKYLAKPLRHNGVQTLQEYLKGYMTYGEFSQLFKPKLSKKYGDKLDEVFRQEIGRALACLHSKGVIHTDIHHRNILVNMLTRQIKIIDFGDSIVGPTSRFLPIRAVTNTLNEVNVASRVRHVGRNNLLISNDVQPFSLEDLKARLKKYPKHKNKSDAKITEVAQNEINRGILRKQRHPTLIVNVGDQYRNAQKNIASALISRPFRRRKAAIRQKKRNSIFENLKSDRAKETTGKQQAKETVGNGTNCEIRTKELLEKKNLNNAEIYELRECTQKLYPPTRDHVEINASDSTRTNSKTKRASSRSASSSRRA